MRGTGKLSSNTNSNLSSARHFGILCDGTVRDTIRVKTIFIIQAELPIADRYIHYKLKWDVYPHHG